MGDFNRYLDKVVAENVLKEKTKLAVARRLAEISAAKMAESHGDEFAGMAVIAAKGKSRSTLMKRRILVPASAIAAAFTVLFAGYILYRIPSSYVSIDINPGIELTLNAIGRVIRAEATNEDGQEVMAGVRINNMKADKAAGQLVQRAYDQGFIDENGSTVISVLAQSEDQDKALQIKEQITERIIEALEQNKAYAAIFADISGLEFRDAAEEAGMSAGKYRLIRMLQTMDPDITMDQYRNAGISLIIQKANELAEDGDNLDSLDDAARAMIGRSQETAEDVTFNQIMAARQKQEQEQNQNSGPVTSGSQGQQSNGTSQQGSDPNQGTSTGTSHQGGDSGQSGSGGGSYSGTSQTGGESGQDSSGGGSYSGISQTGGDSGQGGSDSEPYPGTSQSGEGSSSGTSQTSTGSGQGASYGTSQTGGGSGQGASSGGSPKG
ncbi:MAG: anti-sigma-I factor RsgI family protein [Saccharofermentanales bacterium]